ncbi:hypothetical protein LZK77_16405 [Rhizobium leguminosarum]|nr:hypothetical protein LZK77_16405 [Rhizobium leguminosarum]
MTQASSDDRPSELLGDGANAETTVPGPNLAVDQVSSQDSDIGSAEALTERVAQRYPALRKHQEAKYRETKAEVVGLLNLNLISGTIPRNKSGKISRIWLVDLTKMNKGSITKYYADLLTDYENAISLADLPC